MSEQEIYEVLRDLATCHAESLREVCVRVALHYRHLPRQEDSTQWHSDVVTQWQ